MAKTKTAPKTKTKTTAKPAARKTAVKKTVAKKVAAKKTTKVVRKPAAKKVATDPKTPNIWVAALSYLGIFVLVPLFHPAGRNSFVRFHANQGLALLLLELALVFAGGFVANLLGVLGSMAVTAAWIIIVVLVIVGTSNVAQGERKKLPIIGALADKLNL